MSVMEWRDSCVGTLILENVGCFSVCEVGKRGGVRLEGVDL